MIFCSSSHHSTALSWKVGCATSDSFLQSLSHTWMWIQHVISQPHFTLSLQNSLSLYMLFLKPLFSSGAFCHRTADLSYTSNHDRTDFGILWLVNSSLLLPEKQGNFRSFQQIGFCNVNNYKQLSNYCIIWKKLRKNFLNYIISFIQNIFSTFIFTWTFCLETWLCT